MCTLPHSLYASPFCSLRSPGQFTKLSKQAMSLRVTVRFTICHVDPHDVIFYLSNNKNSIYEQIEKEK